MDEEVQKWSKKDLQGIRDAMTCPEVLESLEKGEMKFEATSGASSCSEDEEEEDGVTEPVFLTTDHHHQTTLPIKTRSNQSINGFSSSPKAIPHRDSNGAISSPMGHNQQLGRTLSSSPEPEYILPDSTMPEINIQSNGSLVDDFGNEITLDGDLSILNPRGGSSVSSGGANLILRKVSASVSPLRSSSIRSGFVYTTTTSNSNLLPHHQNGLNRLVLTNAKLSS
ncbi:hypothetical protein Avbf_02551 [Armadillidium vulgare]|nr:hypothetical protein Avbf_02551 [Armadillidium vulgare]